MSEEQLKAFLEAVKADTGLQEKLKGATNFDSVMAIAKEAGFMISVEELEAAVSARAGKLSDEDLESVAGGRFTGDTCMNASCIIACTSTEIDWCKSRSILSSADLAYCNISTALNPNAPTVTGSADFVNNAQSIRDALQYLAPTTTSANKSEQLLLPEIILDIAAHGKASLLRSWALQIHIYTQPNY